MHHMDAFTRQLRSFQRNDDIIIWGKSLEAVAHDDHKVEFRQIQQSLAKIIKNEALNRTGPSIVRAKPMRSDGIDNRHGVSRSPTYLTPHCEVAIHCPRKTNQRPRSPTCKMVALHRPGKTISAPQKTYVGEGGRFIIHDRRRGQRPRSE